MRVLGLMSGTSADGVDAVLAEFSGPCRRPRWRILASASIPYPHDLRTCLVAVGQGQPTSSGELLELAESLTEQQAEAARRCDPQGRAELVGCHGQTLWHRPPDPASGRRGASWQMLQAPLLAHLLQRPVVHDFRSADLALGGQGAPLVPPADAALLGGIGGWRALLNLGGIANLTLLPPASGPERSAPVLGWDCGPANTLLDLAISRFSQGRLSFDADGAWARSGRIDEALIERWLAEPYFCQSPPKSTGRESFGGEDLDRRLADLGAVAGRAIATGGAGGAGPGGLSSREPCPHDASGTGSPGGPAAADALATLTAFSAAVVAADLQRGPHPRPLELLVAGGGCRNGFLMDQLRRRCRGTAVLPLEDLGIGATEREALAFALLAWWHHRGHPASLPEVTGARTASQLGLLAPCPGPGSAGWN
jgi:anhydro-N-acetylmuramic acid kinase